ncbi:MAG TPA: thiamine phosphate synthase [Polyangiaceae bacterium]|nr:thiamine phosphate synthase [Polyangiaceae bacterium]
MSGLYPIIDVDSLAALKLPVLDFARAVLETQPKLVQLRAKHLSARETLDLLRALRPLCPRGTTELFANDRPDLALLADCDGVHVGQDDLPVSAVRQFAPSLKIGVSTHSLAQLDAALQARPDYAAFGPIFATESKARPDPVVGVEALVEAARRARAQGCSIVAIGGISAGNAAQLAGHGVLAAVIAALVPPDGDLESVADRARDLQAALQGPA